MGCIEQNQGLQWLWKCIFNILCLFCLQMNAGRALVKHSLLIVNNAILLFCLFNFVQKCLFFFCLVKQLVTKDMLKSLIGFPFASFFILVMEGQVKRTALWNMLHINKLAPQIKKQVFKFRTFSLIILPLTLGSYNCVRSGSLDPIIMYYWWWQSLCRLFLMEPEGKCPPWVPKQLYKSSNALRMKHYQ